MVEVIDNVVGSASGLYNKLLDSFSPGMGDAVSVFLFAIAIAVVALFIWYFYNSLSKRNLIALNLRQFNRSEHPAVNKILAIALYLLEYIIIMPLLIFVWFAALSIIVFLVVEERATSQILLLTAALVAAIRILAYHKHEIAKDLAKLFPFITLSVFLLSPGAFDVNRFFSRAMEIPTLFGSILYFLLVILAIEVILRIFYTVMQFWSSQEELHPPKVKKIGR
tara:strand:- start:15273 stop:15941 length:669 start_codon:yes stop_codon:yes gene_type:complete